MTGFFCCNGLQTPEYIYHFVFDSTGSLIEIMRREHRSSLRQPPKPKRSPLPFLEQSHPLLLQISPKVVSRSAAPGDGDPSGVTKCIDVTLLAASELSSAATTCFSSWWRSPSCIFFMLGSSKLLLTDGLIGRGVGSLEASAADMSVTMLAVSASFFMLNGIEIPSRNGRLPVTPVSGA